MKFYNLIRLSIAVLLASSLVTVGCGDGKSKRKTPVKRSGKPGATGAAGAPKSGQTTTSTTGVGKDKGEGSTGAETPEEKEAAAKRAEALKKKVGTEENLEKEIAKSADAGNIIDKNALPAGKYTLTEVQTYLKHMKKSDVMHALRVQELSQESGNVEIDQNAPTDSTGSMSDDTDAGRTIELALGFEVKDPAEFRAARSDFSSFALLTTQVRSDLEGGDAKIEIVNSLGTARSESSTTRASVAELLSTAGTKKDGRHEYTAKDSNQKPIFLRIHSIDDSKVHMVFRIDESDTLWRTVVLVYKVEKAEADSTEK